MGATDGQRRGRDAVLRVYAFVNDNQREVSSNVIEALTSYDITPVLWSQRGAQAEALAA